MTESDVKLKKNSALPIVILIIINVIIFCYSVFLNDGSLEISNDILIKLGGDVPHLSTQGQWWRIFTASFLHGNLMHLISNMAGIAQISRYLSRYFSKSEISLIYFASVFTGGFASLVFDSNYAVSIGASGGVFGLYGAFLTFVIVHGHFNKVDIRILGGAAQLVFFNMGFGVQGINAWAHCGGLFGGVLICLMVVALEESMSRKDKIQLILGGLIMAVGIGTFSLPERRKNIDRELAVKVVELHDAHKKMWNFPVNRQSQESVSQAMQKIREFHLPKVLKISKQIKGLRPRNQHEAEVIRQALLACQASYRYFSIFYSAFKRGHLQDASFRSYANSANKQEENFIKSINYIDDYFGQVSGKNKKRNLANE